MDGRHNCRNKATVSNVDRASVKLHSDCALKTAGLIGHSIPLAVAFISKLGLFFLLFQQPFPLP